IGQKSVSTEAGRITEDDVISYVLSNFPSEERKIIDLVIPVVSEAILCLLTYGITEAMNKYNQMKYAEE
ncbi:hypothetical protein ACFLTT_01105, partial [Chloroflexota bacterium]